MYVSPKHPNPPRMSSPPEPSGVELARFARGPDAELRVSLDEYQGARFLNLRIWTRGSLDSWWPSKKGVSIRLREAGPLSAILGKVAAAVGSGDLAALASRPTPRALQTPKPRALPAPSSPSSAHAPTSADASFDEFD
jgi:hypothetical protein